MGMTKGLGINADADAGQEPLAAEAPQASSRSGLDDPSSQEDGAGFKAGRRPSTGASAPVMNDVVPPLGR